MGAEAAVEVARLRPAAEPPRLQKLSASSGASPGSSPRVEPARQASAASRSRSSRAQGGGPKLEAWQLGAAAEDVTGSMAIAEDPTAPPNGLNHTCDSPSASSDQASPRFLQMLRESLPPQEGGAPELPSTVAALQALQPQAAPGAPPAAAAASHGGGDRQHRRGFLGQLFHRSHKNGGDKAPAEPSAAASDASGGSDGKRRGSGWFSSVGGGGKREMSRQPSTDSERPPLAPAGSSGALLPGLPLLETGNSGSIQGGPSSSRPGSSASNAGSVADGDAAATLRVEAGAGNGACNGNSRLAAGARPASAGYAADVSASEASGGWLCCRPMLAPASSPALACGCASVVVLWGADADQPALPLLPAPQHRPPPSPRLRPPRCWGCRLEWIWLASRRGTGATAPSPRCCSSRRGGGAATPRVRARPALLQPWPELLAQPARQQPGHLASSPAASCSTTTANPCPSHPCSWQRE